VAAYKEDAGGGHCAGIVAERVFGKGRSRVPGC